MEMQVALAYALFLLACFGLAWSVFVTVAKLASAIVYSSRSAPFTFDFTPQVWTGCVSFTVIMGYIFIM